MPGLVLMIVLAVIVFLIVKSVADAQRARGSTPRQATATRRVPVRSKPFPRTRRTTKPLDQQALADHVLKLRDAVARGLISEDEAIASVVRHSEGQLSDEAARRLLTDHGGGSSR